MVDYGRVPLSVIDIYRSWDTSQTFGQNPPDDTLLNDQSRPMGIFSSCERFARSNRTWEPPRMDGDRSARCVLAGKQVSLVEDLASPVGRLPTTEMEVKCLLSKSNQAANHRLPAQVGYD
jgi:hypothetical protein